MPKPGSRFGQPASPASVIALVRVGVIRSMCEQMQRGLVAILGTPTTNADSSGCDRHATKVTTTTGEGDPLSHKQENRWGWHLMSAW